MFKKLALLGSIFLMSCTGQKKVRGTSELPQCLKTKIESMSANPSEGTPHSVSRYHYKGQLVYYMVSACCDKYNIVFDGDCNILGFPDGGYTGRGDGRMSDFYKEATKDKMVWESDHEKEN